MMPTELTRLSATAASGMILAGEISSEELVRASIERIERREGTVRAWRFLDPELALKQARSRDESEDKGPLCGVPVGIKDHTDTADMPTEYGSPIYDGYRPVTDAYCVSRLRASGAVVAGKNKLTELSLYHPTDTANPCDPSRTPGGSSSGSAAAVADFMVPVATGTQTVGSIVRPASYCGVFGFKPTFGAIPRAGILPLAASLDTVGLFARSVEDLALVATVLADPHPHRASMRVAQPTSFDLRDFDETRAPRIAFVRTAQWPELDADIRERLERAVERLGEQGACVEELELPEKFGRLVDAQNTILEVEMARSLSYEFENHPGSLSETLYEILEQGHTVGLEIYLAAQELAAECRWGSRDLFKEHDALLAPSVRGEAPVGLGSTGDPLFCRMWSLLGLPCVSVPGLLGPNGLPLGAQIVGPRYRDDLALSVARWVSKRL
jgi:Asp-tRNA(Asn)/Glu-tRNA(Gln) amidotransferase A subunit family amidase